MARIAFSPIVRVLVATGIVLGILAMTPQTASAQLPYTFRKISDTVATPGLNGVSCVGMNDLGTVVVRFGNDLYKGRDAASFAVVTNAAFSICPSINDNDEIAYTTNGSGPGIVALVKNTNGSIATLAASNTAPALYSPNTHLPSLNNAGRAVYVANGSGNIAIAPTGTLVASNPPLIFNSPESMNDSDVVGFVAQHNTTGQVALYRGSTTPLLQSGDSISGGTIVFSSLQRPGINSAGLMAFIGRLDFGNPGVYGVYTTDGTSVSLVGTNPVDRYSLNNSGSVVIRRTLSGGAGTGLYLGRPGLIDQEVIGQGDALDGSTLQEAFIWAESLNNLGQIAFWAQLADGRRGVYVATPKWLNTIGFTNNLPACGPIAAKVTLTTAAPPGGFTVDLESFNAAAAVPASVVVPAGKKTVSFQITPTPVVANTIGNIEATHGAQSILKRLKIRPITVTKVSLTPNPVIGGGAVVGKVTLDCAAQPADLTVALSSSKPAIATLASPSVIVPQGANSATFDITTSTVAASTTATIKATAKGVTVSKQLVVNP